MTSKISFAKLLKEDIRRRAWLLAVIIVGFFLAGPVNCLMNLGAKFNNVATSRGAYTMSDLKEWYLGFVGFNNGAFLVIICVCAVLCGITGYQYLHSRAKIDLYHSIPVKREKMFLVQYTVGILFFLIPYLCNMVICLLIGAFRGVLTGQHVLYCVGGCALGILYFLMVYHVVILAMMLTGKILVGILGAVVLCGYGPGVSYLTGFLSGQFFQTYFSTQNQSVEAVQAMLSPVTAYSYAAGHIGNGSKFPWIFLGVSILITVVLFFLCIWLYRIRPSEAAESAMAFPKTEGILKVCMIVPASLWAGTFLGGLNSMDVRVNQGWFLFGLLFSLVLLHVVVEFIYHMDFRMILKRKWSLLISAVLVLVCFCIFRFDLLGYDGYLPAKDKVESMSVYTSNFNGNFTYPLENMDSVNGLGDAQRSLDRLEVQNFDMIYQLAEEGVKNKKLRYEYYDKQQADAQSVTEATNGWEQETPVYDDAFVKYHLKSGKTVYRRYFVKDESSKACISKLCDNENYKKRLFPINYIKSENIKRITVTDVYQMETTLNLTDAQKEKLLQIYREEQNRATYDEMTTGVIAGAFTMEITEGNNTAICQFAIYPSFVKTLDTLKEMGYGLRDKWSQENVQSVKIVNYRSVTSQSQPQYSFTEKKDMEDIVNALSWGWEYGPGRSGVDYSLEVDVDWLVDGVKSSGVYYFNSKNIPQCVEEKLQEKGN